MSLPYIVPTLAARRRCATRFVSAITTATAILVALGLVGGCTAPPPSPRPPAALSERPTGGAQPTPALPSALLPDGATITLELAVTPEEISNGLMFRPTLHPDRGMLFLFAVERTPSFWMKNTLIPLDIVFLSEDGAVVDITHDAQPCAADPCPQYVPHAPAWAVLELAAGIADQHHLDNGARLEFRHVPGFPRPPRQ